MRGLLRALGMMLAAVSCGLVVGGLLLWAVVELRVI